MSADNDLNGGRARLQQMLDACGGDERRWPEGASAALAALLASDPTARAALAEAKALDRALAAAPEADAGPSRALADRIMAGIGGAEPAADRGSVVDLSARRAAAARPTLSRHAVWQTAAALAACLLLGVVAGASDMLGSSLDGVAALAGLANEGDTLTAALGEVLQMPNDEETL